MKRVNWYLIVNCAGCILAVYGAALGAEATAKAREVSKVGAVALRLVATSRRPRVGEQIGKRSLSIAFDESSGLDAFERGQS